MRAPIDSSPHGVYSAPLLRGPPERHDSIPQFSNRHASAPHPELVRRRPLRTEQIEKRWLHLLRRSASHLEGSSAPGFAELPARSGQHVAADRFHIDRHLPPLTDMRRADTAPLPRA